MVTSVVQSGLDAVASATRSTQALCSSYDCAESTAFLMHWLRPCAAPDGGNQSAATPCQRAGESVAVTEDGAAAGFGAGFLAGGFAGCADVVIGGQDASFISCKSGINPIDK